MPQLLPTVQKFIGCPAGIQNRLVCAIAYEAASCSIRRISGQRQASIVFSIEPKLSGHSPIRAHISSNLWFQGGFFRRSPDRLSHNHATSSFKLSVTISDRHRYILACSSALQSKSDATINWSLGSLPLAKLGRPWSTVGLYHTLSSYE